MDGFQHTMSESIPCWEAPTKGPPSSQQHGSLLLPTPTALGSVDNNSNSIDTATLTFSSSQALPGTCSPPDRNPSHHTNETPGTGAEHPGTLTLCSFPLSLGINKIKASTLGKNVSHKGLQWVHSLKFLSKLPRGLGNACREATCECRAGRPHHGPPASGKPAT